MVTTRIGHRSPHSKLRYALAYQHPGRKARGAIQQFMMRLSSSLRRYRWAVFVVWVLLLVPSVYLAINHSDRLTGGGFEVAGSQSLDLQHQLEEQFPDQGASPLALVAVPLYALYELGVILSRVFRVVPPEEQVEKPVISS